MKVGDLVQWDLHTIYPKGIVVGFNGDFAEIRWFGPERKFHNGRVSCVGKKELKVISESR